MKIPTAGWWGIKIADHSSFCIVGWFGSMLPAFLESGGWAGSVVVLTALCRARVTSGYVAQARLASIGPATRKTFGSRTYVSK